MLRDDHRTMPGEPSPPRLSPISLVEERRTMPGEPSPPRLERVQWSDDEVHLKMISTLGTLAQSVSTLADRVCAPSKPAPTLHKLSADDDIDNFLIAFERIAHLQEWHPSTWSVQLSGLLTGKALAAYARLDDTQLSDYAAVKQAILAEYRLHRDSYRRQFRLAKPEKGESYSGFARRLTDLARKWLKPNLPAHDCVLDQIVLEQFCDAIAPQLTTFIRETGAESLCAAVSAAERYASAHEQFSSPQNVVDCPLPTREHKVSYTTRPIESTTLPPTMHGPTPPRPPTRVLTQPHRCYICMSATHLSRNCPRRRQMVALLADLGDDAVETPTPAPNRPHLDYAVDDVEEKENDSRRRL